MTSRSFTFTASDVDAIGRFLELVAASVLPNVDIQSIGMPEFVHALAENVRKMHELVLDDLNIPEGTAYVSAVLNSDLAKSHVASAMSEWVASANRAGFDAIKVTPYEQPGVFEVVHV
jgi:hypothetical protein